MLEDKISRYERDLVIAKGLVKNTHADQEYYGNMVHRLEKMLRYYKSLRVWNDLSKV